VWKCFFCIFEPWLGVRSAILNFQLEKLCYSHYILLGLSFLMFAGTYIRMYVCTYVCLHVCMYICMCKYVTAGLGYLVCRYEHSRGGYICVLNIP